MVRVAIMLRRLGAEVPKVFNIFMMYSIFTGIELSGPRITFAYKLFWCEFGILD
jgi:hypothetical protein